MTRPFVDSWRRQARACRAFRAIPRFRDPDAILVRRRYLADTPEPHSGSGQRECRHPLQNR